MATVLRHPITTTALLAMAATAGAGIYLSKGGLNQGASVGTSVGSANGGFKMSGGFDHGAEEMAMRERERIYGCDANGEALRKD